MFKKSVFFVISFAVLIAGKNYASAASFFGFRDNVDSASLKPFAADMGDLLGSATFHSGRPLGFSGFDLGIHGVIQLRPDQRDNILRRSSGAGAFGIPWVMAEIGLPFRLDGFIRGINYQGMTVAGGGLRYGLFPVSDLPWSPQILLSGAAHAVSDQDFTATHYGFNLVGSLNFPVFTPYIGVGIDRTRVTVLADAKSLPGQSLVGTSATVAEPRYTAGVTIRPFPFSYVHAAFTETHGQPGFDVGLGARF